MVSNILCEFKKFELFGCQNLCEISFWTSANTYINLVDTIWKYPVLDQNAMYQELFAVTLSAT